MGRGDSYEIFSMSPDVSSYDGIVYVLRNVELQVKVKMSKNMHELMKRLRQNL